MTGDSVVLHLFLPYDGIFLARNQAVEPLPFPGLAQTLNASFGSDGDAPPQLFSAACLLLSL